MDFYSSEFVTYIFLPLLIFISRIFDVSIGTLRIIFVSKGHKFIAPILGFFEVLIWIIGIGKIMENLDNVVFYVAYAGGFAAGNYIGMLLEEKMALGVLVVRIITRKDLNDVVSIIKTFNPKAFYLVEDVRFVSDGVFKKQNKKSLGTFKSVRKGT